MAPQSLTPAERLWREACVAPSLEALAATLVAGLPPGVRPAGLAVLDLDLELGTADLAGAAPPGAAPSLPEGGRLLDEDACAALARWLPRTAVARLVPGAAGPKALRPLAGLLPPGAWWILPLPGEGARHGLALLDLPDGDAAPRRLPGLLREPLAAALANHRRSRELEALRRAAEADRQALLTRLGRDQVAEGVVGADGGLSTVMARVAMVAGADVPVLVLGETGSGKEVIARELHARSRRSDGPFVRVNCGAIAPELVDSELFGHEKGAFTGASARRLGWFERADGGTLLLDEIGELPKAAQVRLLRVLQDGTLQRVGGEDTVRVDVRIIAATHADLAAMVQAGEFREDLWYRLAVFPLLLPPLRDRRQDIPALVDMLARRAARRFGFRPQAPRSADLALLLEYPWPGNVRELGAVVDRAVLLGEGRSLEFAQALGFDSQRGPHPARARAVAPEAVPAAIATLDEVVTRHLELALVAAGGRVEGPAGAAALLGLNPNTLRSKLRRYGIAPRAFRG